MQRWAEQRRGAPAPLPRPEPSFTFRCSAAVRGLSGVACALAGVAAAGEEELFSIRSAGIVVAGEPARLGIRRSVPCSESGARAGVDVVA